VEGGCIFHDNKLGVSPELRGPRFVDTTHLDIITWKGDIEGGAYYATEQVEVEVMGSDLLFLAVLELSRQEGSYVIPARQLWLVNKCLSATISEMNPQGDMAKSGQERKSLMMKCHGWRCFLRNGKVNGRRNCKGDVQCNRAVIRRQLCSR